MNDIIYFIASYLMVLFIAFAIINWLQRGLFWQFLKVKASKGNKVLCKIRGRKEDYYRTGVPKDDGLVLKFKGDKTESNLVNVPTVCYYRSASVDFVDIDEASKMAISKDWVAVNTHDAIITTNLIRRAQMSSNDQDNLIIALIIIGVINFLAVIVLGFILSGKIDEVAQIIGNSTQIVGNNI